MYVNRKISAEAAVFFVNQISRDIDVGTIRQTEDGWFQITQTEDQFYESLDDCRFILKSVGAGPEIMNSGSVFLEELTA